MRFFTGLAIASTDAGDRLYAADFHNGKIIVFDGAFTPIVNDQAFIDSSIPAEFAPYGIQNIADRIYVTYAKKGVNPGDVERGLGLGYVSVFEVDGTFIGRIASRGKLNAPWGMALAPSHFGPASKSLIVGNFGDGRVDAFKISRNGRHVSSKKQFKGPDHEALVIDGLRGLAFGKGQGSGAPNALYFTAGPVDGAHGLFGYIVWSASQ